MRLSWATNSVSQNKSQRGKGLQRAVQDKVKERAVRCTANAPCSPLTPDQANLLSSAERLLNVGLEHVPKNQGVDCYKDQPEHESEKLEVQERGQQAEHRKQQA